MEIAGTIVFLMRSVEWWAQLGAVMYLSAICSEILQVHTLVGVVLFGAFVPVSEKPFVMGHIDILNRALFLPGMVPWKA